MNIGLLLCRVCAYRILLDDFMCLSYFYQVQLYFINVWTNFVRTYISICKVGTCLSVVRSGNEMVTDYMRNSKAGKKAIVMVDNTLSPLDPITCMDESQSMYCGENAIAHSCVLPIPSDNLVVKKSGTQAGRYMTTIALQFVSLVPSQSSQQLLDTVFVGHMFLETTTLDKGRELLLKSI